MPDSVDLLLKEFNAGEPDQSTAEEGILSPILSPIKPLNFKDSENQLKQPESRKDFNSSSDTCVSDIMEKHSDDEANDAADVNDRSLAHSPAPKSSQTSPSKSIIKSGNNSPKKSVAFPQTLHTLHTYNPPTPQTPPSGSPSPESYAHLWTPFDTSLVQLDITSTPPVPPPHSSSTITGLLNANDSDDSRNDDFNPSELANYRKLLSSNLFANEQISLMLDTPQTNRDDLDIHLDRLKEAAANETDVNIHQLSYHLNMEQTRTPDNPLNTLGTTTGLYLNSAHSSQSSLQSLVDSNRQLEANQVELTAPAAIFNDGIQGFSDAFASQLIAHTSGFNINLPSLDKSDASSKDDFKHVEEPRNEVSLNLTEKSILNLLNSASQHDLNELGPNIKEESFRAELSPAGHEYPPLIKQEMVDPEVRKDSPQPPTVSLNKAATLLANFSLDESRITLSQDNDDIRVKLESEELDPTENLPSSDPSPDIESDNNHVIKSEPQEGLVEQEGTDASETGSENSHKNNTTGQLFVVETYQVNGTVINSGSVKLVNSTAASMKSPKVTSDNEADYSSDSADELPMASNVKLETEHHAIKEAPGNTQTAADTTKMPAPSSPVALPTNHTSLAPKPVETQQYQKTATATVPTFPPEEHDSSVLANSSNINPPTNIKLPLIEDDGVSFADITRKLEENSASFEESLSAEHDADRKSLDFLSIWHSQQISRRPKSQNQFYKIPLILKYNISNVARRGQVPIPQSLKPKKFTDVNLVSSKVVNPNFENLHVSGFLPEISQDSGIESHFKSFIENNDTVTQHNGDLNSSRFHVTRRRSFDSRNILSEIDALHLTHRIAERRHSTIATLRPGVKQQESKQKRSKFHVPSFEIKRSNSILSPRNLYNDIFQDTSFVEPTIKASGLKTLPSMDREDVHRIMQMKQSMTQEEYARLRKVGSRTVSALQQASNDRFDSLRATVHCDSLLSTKKSATDLSQPLDQKPRATPMPPIRASLHESSQSESNQHPIVINPTLPKPKDQFPEPDPELVNSPVGSPIMSKQDSEPEPVQVTTKSQYNPFRVSEMPKEQSMNLVTPQPTTKPRTPKFHVVDSPQKNVGEQRSARSSPIKLHSPVRIVKNNGSVTGIVIDKTFKRDAETLENKKLRAKGSDAGQLSAESDSSEAACTGSKEPETVPAPEANGPIEGLSQNEEIPSASDKIKVEERGKLFFRVQGLDSVSIPELADRNVNINLTLDNGVHCIKTPNYQLKGREVTIGKEFELTASDSLQFILTMKATYEPPKASYKEVKERKVVKSKNRLGRLFGSREIITTTKYVPQEVEDPLDGIFATDGSFARCYVDLEQYEYQITGQACNFKLTCFNEWAHYKEGGERRLKRPYPIAELQVKMLFIPRTEDYEILPMSIKSAYESLDDLKLERRFSLEGYMHQEGGDCETWKRRFFRLEGTSLVAHSEYLHKTRARINLGKVVEVIYVDKENAGRNKNNYRDFSDILLMENAFKIRFVNGETINFGAPTPTEKILWLKTIQEIVYRNKFRRQPWVRLMQERNGDKRLLWVESS